MNQVGKLWNNYYRAQASAARPYSVHFKNIYQVCQFTDDGRSVQLKLIDYWCTNPAPYFAIMCTLLCPKQYDSLPWYMCWESIFGLRWFQEVYSYSSTSVAWSLVVFYICINKALSFFQSFSPCWISFVIIVRDFRNVPPMDVSDTTDSGFKK